MKIKFTHEIDVPCSPWCGNCFKVIYEESGKPVCGLSGIYLDEVRGKLLKTIRCYDQLYFALVQEGRKNGKG